MVANGNKHQLNILPNINGILKATKEQKMQKEEQKKKTSISFTVHF